MKRRILLGIETLMPGGAESFIIRLANGLSHYFDVTVFVFYADKINGHFVNRQENHFDLVIFKMQLDFFVRKIDSLFLKLRIDFQLRDLLVQARIRKILSSGSIAVLHSNQFRVDHVFNLANKKYKIPHFTTIHGDYINFYQQMRNGRLSIINYPAKAKRVLSQLNGISYISDHQLQFMMRELNLDCSNTKVRKIYNGVENNPVLTDDAGFSFSKKGFTFGMVARAIPEKGWECAIRAFLKLNRPGTQLILVGEGAHLNELKKQYPHPEIYFVGYSSNPLRWISCFDAGLLPTTYPSESLPTTVIEYLLMRKPVIATDVGEIRNMINQKGTSSGILLPVVDNIVSDLELVNAMEKLIDDKDLYKALSAATTQHAKTFDIKTCIDNYVEFYAL